MTPEISPNATTLEPGAHRLTLINTYAVDPERAEDLLAFLIASTHSTIKHVPGFLSANLHVSLDRTLIVNYAQWTHQDAIKAAAGDANVVALMKEQMRIARSFAPVPFELRASIAAAQKTPRDDPQ